jgi:hypothetical protein
VHEQAPASVTEVDLKDLNPSIDRANCLIARWSRSSSQQQGKSDQTEDFSTAVRPGRCTRFNSPLSTSKPIVVDSQTDPPKLVKDRKMKSTDAVIDINTAGADLA